MIKPLLLQTVTVRVLALCCIGVILSVSCRKNKDINWTEALRGTAWAGEFRFTSGGYTGPQPFSMVFNNDSTLIFYHVEGPSNGVWKTEGNTITIQFTANTIVTASIGHDSCESFNNVTNHGWKMINLYRTAVLQPQALEGTTWKGKTGPADYKIIFLAGNKLQAVVSNVPAPPVTYTIAGAGIRFTTVVTNDNYGVFINKNNSIHGIYYEGSGSALWNVKKQ
jgi:hypothetical protein